jgi:serpin B
MVGMKSPLILTVFGALIAAMSYGATGNDLAATATNQLAVDLHHQLATGNENLCVSPYSIESALAMTFTGADGETRTEMARVLHFPEDANNVRSSFAALQHSLEEMSAKTAELVKESKKFGGPGEPITLNIANRLFAQKSYDFRQDFLSLVKQNFGAAFEPLDFVTDASGATRHINQWVANQTHDRIRDLIPAGALNEMTRLVLANALYLKAPWADPFSENATIPEPFHVHGGTPVDVPMMRKTDRQFGYAKRDGFTAVSLPYVGSDLQFVVLLPDDVNGLRALESKLTNEMLAECARLETGEEIDLHLPKFKIEPPTIALAEKFEALGMKTAFDQPRGSANFDRMAPRKPKDYLYISQIFHKTFIAVDEKGTEAAAATAVAMMRATALAPKRQPIEVKVDRPFVYAIQHVPSGVCLFLGRVTDPR